MDNRGRENERDLQHGRWSLETDRIQRDPKSRQDNSTSSTAVDGARLGEAEVATEMTEEQMIVEAQQNALRIFNELRELPYREQAWFASYLRRASMIDSPEIWWLPELFTVWPFTAEYRLIEPRRTAAPKLSGDSEEYADALERREKGG